MNTTTEQFLDNPDYVKSVQLLLQLHELTVQGKFESEEADAVRDASEKPWYQLNEAEQIRVRVLSANLDMLIEDEVFRPVPSEQRTQAGLEPRIKAAFEAGEWDTILALLRNGPDFMPIDMIAGWRGLAYLNLGHPEVALLFAEYALQKNPDNIEHALLVITILRQLHRVREAIILANRILEDAGATLLQRFKAISMLFFAVLEFSELEAHKEFVRIAPMLQQLLSVEDDTGLNEIKQVLGIKPYLILVTCYGSTGQFDAALKAVHKALELEPGNSSALEAKEILTSNFDAETKERRARSLAMTFFADTAGQLVAA